MSTLKSAKQCKTEAQILEQLIKEEALEIIPFAKADIEKIKSESSPNVSRICYPCEGSVRNFWLIYEDGKIDRVQYKVNDKFKSIKL